MRYFVRENETAPTVWKVVGGLSGSGVRMRKWLLLKRVPSVRVGANQVGLASLRESRGEPLTSKVGPLNSRWSYAAP